MVDQYDRVSIGDQGIHDSDETFDVGRVETDGRFVEDVQYAGGPVAYGPCHLSALSFSGGQGGGGAVEGQISKTQIHQTCCCVMERLADVLCHLFHLGGEGIGNAFDPFHEIREGHLAYLVEGDSPEKWFPGPLAQSGSVAAGAGTALEEPLHPLHPFLVLDFGEGVLYGINCVVVGEVHLPCVTGFLVVIEQVLLLGRSVEDYPPLLLGEVLERDVGTYSHIPCDILHQGPHEGLPRGNGTFVDGLVLVGDQGGLVHFLNHAGTVAFPACAGAVESKFLCARG